MPDFKFRRLPLTPFEEYMLLDDRPAYPMNFFIRLCFSGRLDPVAMGTALAQALARHPLLTVVARKHGWRWVWQPAECQPRMLHGPGPPSLLYPPMKPLDVRLEPGLRLIMRQDDARADLTFQFHHACCDGLAGILFAKDVGLLYMQIIGQTPLPRLPPLNPGLLLRRNSFGPTLRKMLKLLPRWGIALRGAREFTTHRPEPIRPHESDWSASAPHAEYPAACIRELSPGESARFVEGARRRAVSPNELLLRDFFLALDRWQRRHLPGRERHRLRVSVPINLRPLTARHLPAANAVSMVFLDRHPEQLEDPDGLLDTVHRQMDIILERQLGLSFLLSLQLARWWPGGLARRVQNRQWRASAVFSNMGTILERLSQHYPDGCIRLGTATLEGVDGLVPLRPGTAVAVSVFKYAGRLKAALHYDPRVLTRPEGEELMDGFMACLRDSGGSH